MNGFYDIVNSKDILIAAHRGNSLNTPENTIIAFEKAVEAGVDGLIIADTGAMIKLAKAFPDVLINASTQMNVYSEDEFYNLSKLGVNRIVLPR